MTQIADYTDDELRQHLKDNGVNCGPITCKHIKHH